MKPISAKLVIASGAVALLGACSSVETATSQLTIPNPEYRYDTRYPISVESAPVMLELPVAERLSPQDAMRVAAFARAYQTRAETPITIAYPSNVFAGKTIDTVQRNLERNGVASADILRGSYDPETEGDRGVVVSFYGREATSPACPNFWGDTVEMFDNRSARRFGCATQNNLAAMLADPQDAVTPSEPGATLAARRTIVIERYTQGQLTAAERPVNQAQTRSVD